MNIASLEWVVINDLLVSFVTPGQIPNEVFQRYLEALRMKQVTRYIALIGGVVEFSSLQRKQSAEAGKRLRVAAVTDERIMRGIITAVSWLGVDIKAFAWSELKDAIAYVQAQALEARIMVEMKKLKESALRNRMLVNRGSQRN